MTGAAVSGPVRVLVVDDAAFMRRTLVRLLRRGGGVEIVGEARDGREAVSLFESGRPEVVCLDVDMPAMDGTTALKHFMARRPTPVVVVSSLTERDDVPFELFRLGAVDFFPKPSSLTGALEDQARQLLHLVRNARSIRVENLQRVPLGRPIVPIAARQSLRHVLVLGGTVGSIGSLLRVLSLLPPAAQRGVGVVCMVPLHAAITASFERSVGSLFGWATSRLSDGFAGLAAGHVCFVDPGVRVLWGDGGLTPAGRSEAALDELLACAGELHRDRATVVLLGGSDAAGLAGIARASAAGARGYIQDPATALFETWRPNPPAGVELLTLETIVARIEATPTRGEEAAWP